MMKYAFTGLVLCSLLNGASAQFGYAGADLRFSWLNLGEKNKITRTIVDLHAEWRPLRNVGIGFSYPLTLTQNVNYSLSGLRDFELNYGRGDLYDPVISNDISFKEEFGAYIRFYLDTRSSFFMDLRLRSIFTEQNFILTRAGHGAVYYFGDVEYAAIPTRYWAFAQGSRSLSPGISLGFAPHVGKSGFILACLDIDMIDIDFEQRFFLIESDYVYFQNAHEYTLLSNTLGGSHTIWSLRFGGGIRF